MEETDPSWVKTKHNALEWTNGKLVTDLGPTSGIAQFFDNEDNRFRFFTSLGETRGVEVHLPQLPLLPMEITLKVMRTDTNPWELYQLLLEFEVGKDDFVKGILATCQKLDKSRINQEGGLQHNGNDKCTRSEVLVKGPQGLPEG